MTEWKNLEAYPQAYKNWAISKSGKIKNFSSTDDVKKHLKDYNIFSKLLVSTNESKADSTAKCITI